MKPANNAPVYAAALYPELAEICRNHGYALACHGSLARDFDLVAIPWTEHPTAEPLMVIDDICSQFAIKLTGDLETKEHGRKTYTLGIGFGECFVDLSFMPLSR